MLLSIIPDASSSGATLFAITLELVMIFWTVRVRKSPHVLKTGAVAVAILLCLLFYLFNMTSGDYFSYKKIVEDAGITQLLFYSATEFHVEIAYVAIINFVQNNYLLFRLIVWGGALTFFCLTALYLKLDRSTFIFYLSTCIVPLTVTSRIGLAYAVAFMGFAMLVYSPQRFKIINIILGVLLVYGSFWLHRSAPFLLVVFPLALLEFNKRTMKILLFAIPILVLIIQSGLIDYIFSMNTTAEDSLFDAQTAQSYLSSEMRFGSKGPGELIRLFFEYLSFALVLLLVYRTIKDGTYKLLPGHIQKFMNAAALVIVFAFAFLIMPGANTYKTFERLIAFAIVPSALFLSYFLKNDIEKNLVNKTTLSFLCWVIYDALYTLYLESIVA